ncbi:hypothetical protein [Coxiella-like endosymbiont of Rhipicephalus sanguineus]|uniref:hypothetical protein n=1 Tax=Coxiella-like endosymbiont of Rhipicephalus sanguineus TaxID=1955402 RepID=UPI00204153A3|nr:hypothetical protein [Coxiella-like endosymbiont of Rhipicephalus sanguineus]
MTIGITTIAAFIGAGGLGNFITQGLSVKQYLPYLTRRYSCGFISCCVRFHHWLYRNFTLASST